MKIVIRYCPITNDRVSAPKEHHPIINLNMFSHKQIGFITKKVDLIVDLHVTEILKITKTVSWISVNFNTQQKWKLSSFRFPKCVPLYDGRYRLKRSIKVHLKYHKLFNWTSEKHCKLSKQFVNIFTLVIAFMFTNKHSWNVTDS